MFSKSPLRLSIVMGCCIVFLSCNLKIGETPPSAVMPEYKTDSCFSQTTQTFTDFFAGNAKDHEIAGAWDCLGSMVKDFTTKVRCKVRDKCSPGEIAQFVEDNFLEDDPAKASQAAISKELQLQLMKFKKLFLGGNLEYITTSELERFITLLGKLRDISRDINPSMKVLTLNLDSQLKNSDLGLDHFEAVNENLIKLAQRLSGLIDKENNVYYFQDFHSFVNELSRLVGGNSSWITTMGNYLPLVKKLKKSINGGDEESLKDNEWNLFLLLGSRAYIQFLRYYYFIKDLDPKFTSLKLAYIAKTIEEVFQILYDLISFKESHQVTKAEIEDLFKSFSNIWPVLKTSPGLVGEAMKLKQVFIGGTDNGFEKNDFLKAQAKVELIKQIVEKFIPFYQFYGLSWHPELLKQADSFAYFSKASTNLDEIVSKMTDEFKFETGYSLKSLISLLNEIDKLYPPANGENALAKSLLEYSCLIQLTTDVVLDAQNHKIKNSCDQIELSNVDLGNLVKKGSELFNIYLDYHYFVSKSRLLFNDLEFQIKVKDFTYNIVDFLKTTIEQRKSERISIYEIKSFVEEAVELDLIPKNIRKSTIDSLLETLLTKVLVPEKLKMKKVRYDGLEPFHIEQVGREVDNFLSLNIFIHQAFENKINQKFDHKYLLARFKKSILDSSNPNFRLGMTEFVRNFQSSFPMILSANNRIFFKRIANPLYDKNTLEKYNLNRFLAGILMRSYAVTSVNSTKHVLTDCEVKNAFIDLKPILVDLDIISESSGTGFIDARFIEANLFLTKSDGNDTVSFDELAELASYIFSGFSIDGEAKKLIAADCQYTPVGKDLLVDLSCLRFSYKKNLTKLLSSMPAYVSYSQNENPSEWEGAFLNNLKTAGYVPRPDSKVSLSDAALFPHILQYGETIFIKFDLNGDGLIDKNEGRNAFPYFVFLLKKVAKKQIEDGSIKETELEALFTYILKFGKIPECNRSFVLLCLFDRNVTQWLDWKKNYLRDEYTLSANRTQISKILGIISDLVTTSPSVREKESCPTK